MLKFRTILFCILGLFAGKMYACDCVGERSAESALANSDFVISGTVVGILRQWVPDSAMVKELVDAGVSTEEVSKRFRGHFIKKVLVLVSATYKGEFHGDTLSIYTGMGGGDCGYQFSVGRKYIIYGSRASYFEQFFEKGNYPTGDNIYWTSICSRTREFYRSEIEELERIKN